MPPPPPWSPCLLLPLAPIGWGSSKAVQGPAGAMLAKLQPFRHAPRGGGCSPRHSEHNPKCLGLPLCFRFYPSPRAHCSPASSAASLYPEQAPLGLPGALRGAWLPLSGAHLLQILQGRLFHSVPAHMTPLRSLSTLPLPLQLDFSSWNPVRRIYCLSLHQIQQHRTRALQHRGPRVFSRPRQVVSERP